jgi:hypothetical protein
MTTESDALREALFAQMSAPPLPEYSGNTVILRGRKMPTANSVAQHLWAVASPEINLGSNPSDVLANIAPGEPTAAFQYLSPQRAAR